MVKDIFQGLSIETNEFAFDIKAILSFESTCQDSKVWKNSKLLTLTLATFEVKIALGTKITFTDG